MTGMFSCVSVGVCNRMEDVDGCITRRSFWSYQTDRLTSRRNAERSPNSHKLLCDVRMVEAEPK